MASIAAQTMAWQRRMGALAGPLASSASATGPAGTTNPVTVEIFINGAWVDVTSYVMVRDDSGDIAITRGRRDEGSETEQSTCRMTLNNRDGRWSPRNPTGAYYGYIGRNQPVRVSVPDGNGGICYRFQGEISVWPQEWDTTGTDVWTEVEASGILRRLAQGPPSAHSVMYNVVAVPPSSNLRAYWPCEDPDESVSLSSPIVTYSAMTFTGNPDLAGYDGFPASDPVVLLDGSTLTGTVARYDDPTMTQVRFFCYIPPDGVTYGKVICAIDQLDYSPGNVQFWELYYGNFTNTSTSFTLRTHASDGTNLGADLECTYDVRGKKLYVSVEFQESGANVIKAVRLYDIASQQSFDVTATHNSTALSRVTKVQFGPASRSVVGPIGTVSLAGVPIGHVTVEDTITPITAFGAHLNPINEKAGTRIARICDENGITFESVGDLADTVAMGNQGKLNALDLMQECEAADAGMIYESMTTLGLGYRTRTSMLNQTSQLTLDYASFNLSEIPKPVEDDRYIQNQVNVTVSDVTKSYSLTSGALSVQFPPAGVGPYGDDVTLNLASSSQALDQASWRVHMGTVDEPRYPQISVNLAHSTFTNNPALKRAVLGLRQGDRIVVQNPPSWLPPGDIDQIILGFEESITHFEHKVTFLCAPASPYRVGVADGDYSYVDTDGSELLLAASSGATTLYVRPSAGQTGLWTTDSTNFPVDIRVGGEVMRVTNITPYVLDAFGRTATSAWDSPDVGFAWQITGGTSTDYNVGSGVGIHRLATANAARISYIDLSTATDFDVYTDVSTSATATGGFLSGSIVGRYIDVDNMYIARLEFSTTNTMILTIRKRVGATETSLGTYTLTDTYVPTTYYRIRFSGQGTNFKAKAWLASDAETPEWQVSVADSSIQTSVAAGVRSISSAANTNVNPTVTYDNFSIVNPQIFTVSRSINAVVKSQTAGTDVRLAYPTVFSL